MKKITNLRKRNVEASKKILKKANIFPKLRLAEKIVKDDGKPGGTRGTGPHTVALLEDKVVTGIDYDSGKEVHKMRYIVSEGGEKKQYDTPLNGDDGQPSYLVQRLAEIEPGTEVILEYKKAGARGYIDVRVLGEDGQEVPEETID
jgi:hypothetical protein